MFHLHQPDAQRIRKNLPPQRALRAAADCHRIVVMRYANLFQRRLAIHQRIGNPLQYRAVKPRLGMPGADARKAGAQIRIGIRRQFAV